MFERLVKNNIFLHPLKCVWGVTKLNYLGLTISPGLVSVSEEKIAALKAYAVPQGVADVRRYLGFVQLVFSCVRAQIRGINGTHTVFITGGGPEEEEMDLPGPRRVNSRLTIPCTPCRRPKGYILQTRGGIMWWKPLRAALGWRVVYMK